MNKYYLYNFLTHDMYYFSRKSVSEIWESYNRQIQNSNKKLNYYETLFINENITTMDEGILLNKIEITHIEYVIPYLIVYFWQQKNNNINREKFLWLDSEEILYIDTEIFLFNYLRMMTLNGYPNMLYYEYYDSNKMKTTSIHERIETMLSVNKNKEFDNDYFCDLGLYWGIIGPYCIKNYERYNKIVDFIIYIIEKIDEDDIVEQIRIQDYLQLINDINYINSKSLDCLIKLFDRSFDNNMIEAILSVQLFGNKIYETIKNRLDYSFYGGFNNFCQLVKLF